jgi:hypothetical protein
VHIQRLISVAKMATVLEGCTTEEKCYVVFLLLEGLYTKDIHKKCFLFMVGSVCHV